MGPISIPPMLVPLRMVTRAACLLVLSHAGAAVAQSAPEDPAAEEARRLFEEGLGFADADDWERAVERFRRALALRESAPIRYNLARSLASLGRVTEALEEAARILAQPGADAAARAAATELRSELQARLGRLTVVVAGESAGAHVTIDGRPLRPEALGAPAVVGAGVRVARLVRGADELDVQEVEVPPGGTAAVVLEAPSAARATGGADDWVAPVVVGVAVVLVGAAVLAGVLLAEAGSQPAMGDFLPARLEFD